MLPLIHSRFGLMVKHMEILSLQEGSAKGTLYHLICFFYVRKGLLLCFPKQKLKGGFMGSKFAEGRLVFLTFYLQMIL